MIVDTSALIALLRHEPDSDRLRDRLLLADHVWISAGTLVECRIIAERYGVGEELAELLTATRVRTIQVDAAQADMAHVGFKRLGKGRHPAALNLGDLFAYALARTLEEPLLFKGRDFTQTDIEPAIPPLPYRS